MLLRCICAFEYSVIYTVYYIMGFKKKVLSFLFQVNYRRFCNSLLFKILQNIYIVAEVLYRVVQREPNAKAREPVILPSDAHSPLCC